MDISVFYLNKKRFWSWILIPLVVRLMITTVFSYTTRSAVEELSHYEIYRYGVTVMEQALEQGEEIIAPYKEDEMTPFMGWFLTVVARNSRLANVEADVDEKLSEPIKGTKLIENSFKLSGSATSLHDLSVFVDLMMLDPKAVITEINVNLKTERSGQSNRTDITETEVYKFELSFERVELSVEGGA